MRTFRITFFVPQEYSRGFKNGVNYAKLGIEKCQELGSILNVTTDRPKGSEAMTTVIGSTDLDPVQAAAIIGDGDFAKLVLSWSLDQPEEPPITKVEIVPEVRKVLTWVIQDLANRSAALFINGKHSESEDIDRKIRILEEYIS